MDHFEYGRAAGYGSSTGEQNVPSGATLSCGSAYHYRVVGTDAGGQTAGADRSFTTGPCPPAVAVTSSGDCHPACTVTFTATATKRHFRELVGLGLRDRQPGDLFRYLAQRPAGN